jgi:hypothetical protein
LAAPGPGPPGRPAVRAPALSPLVVGISLALEDGRERQGWRIGICGCRRR